THAMLQMDDRLAWMQFCQVTDQRVRVYGATAILATTRHALAQQIAFADQGPVVEGIDKAMLGGTYHQIAAIAGRLVEAQNAFRCELNSPQQLAQRFTTAFAFYGEDHRAGKALKEFAQIVQR